MGNLKPIETVYNGYRFRSRSEARYAVLFDAMGIKYLYEPEGYDLGDGDYYLPDFYLPDANQYFEVKPDIKKISPKDIRKINKLADQSGRYVIIGDGQFRLTGDEPDIFGQRRDGEFLGCGTHLVKCRKCETLYFENELSYACTACGYYDGDSTFDYISLCDEQFAFALNAAKQARFEHGETPNIKRR